MAGVTAHITDESVTLTSRRKGKVGNYIGYKKILDPAGATGATTVSVSGLDITVNLKNDGEDPTATMGEVFSALSGSTDVQEIAAVVQIGASGATGVAFTGTGGAFVRGISGAESGSAVMYDSLGDATGAGQWKKASGNTIDNLTRTRGALSARPGTEERVSAVTATGATTAILSAGRSMNKLAAKGAVSPTEF
jgi:hypothetical protein